MHRPDPESGESLGLCGGSEIWLMKPAVEDSGADLEQAVCATLVHGSGR